MPFIGAVADDLTGATTTGVLLARSGAKVAAFFNEEAIEKAEDVESYGAFIVSSNSRALSAGEAYEKVKSATIALRNNGVRYFSKRIDTTLRGGIGVEIDAMLDQMDKDTVAVVVPAMPQSRRILVGGYSVIDGVALIRTPVSKDVRTPVLENYIPKLLQNQTRRKVGLVTLNKVLEGVQSVKETLQINKETGNAVIVVDAITLEDVSVIAQACIELEWNVLAVDPGAFTSKLAYHRGLIGEEKPNIPEAEVNENKTVLVVAGSASPTTKNQMEILSKEPNTYSIHSEPIHYINGGDNGVTEAERVVKEAVHLLQQSPSPKAIIIETAVNGELLNLDEEDRKRNYASGLSANRINAGLGMIVSKILEEVGREKIAGVYATGGDTMVNVCYQLGVESIELIDYVIPQADVGRLVGCYDRMPIIGKGGLTGSDHTAVDIVDRLFKEDGRR